MHPYWFKICLTAVSAWVSVRMKELLTVGDCELLVA